MENELKTTAEERERLRHYTIGTYTSVRDVINLLNAKDCFLDDISTLLKALAVERRALEIAARVMCADADHVASQASGFRTQAARELESEG